MSSSTESPPQNASPAFSTLDDAEKQQSNNTPSSPTSPSAAAPLSSKVGGTTLVAKRWGALFSTLVFAMHLLWLQFYLWFGRFYVNFVGGPINSFHRKLVVIGDDTALGVGDWVTLLSYPGVHRRFNDVINRDVTTRPVGRGIFWDAFEAGRSGATSTDWLPEKETAELKAKKKWRLIGARNVFESCFDPNVGVHRDAEVVVVLLGKHDLVRGMVTPEDTCRNLTKMTVELLKRNKHVVLCTVPNYPVVLEQPARRTAWKDLNDGIQNVVNRIRLTLPKERYGMVTLCDISSRPLPATSYRFDGRFLTGKGYDSIAKDMQNEIIAVMRRIDADKAILKATPQYSHFR